MSRKFYRSDTHFGRVTFDEIMYKKLIADIGEAYKRELDKLTLLELISIISKASAEASCQQFILFNNVDVRRCTENYIKEFIQSIPLGFDIENIESDFSCNYNRVNMEDLNIDIPEGYSVYVGSNKRPIYIIKTGLTKERAYSYYTEKWEDEDYTELMMIKGNEICEHYLK